MYTAWYKVDGTWHMEPCGRWGGYAWRLVMEYGGYLEYVKNWCDVKGKKE